MELHTLLSQTIDSAKVLLIQLEEDRLNKVNPDHWSAKEILGHLIDSAINNRRRFMQYQINGTLEFSGYVQDAWVALSNYQDWSWTELIEGWYIRNRELSKIIELIPADSLQKEHVNHNLYNVAFKKVPLDKPASLSYFITDYISHMEHHLSQILPSYKRIISEY